MVAYVVVDIAVNDSTRYEEYKKLAPPAIAAYGGRYLARGGRVEALEGDWSPHRVVILEFESVERAKEWLHSPEYRDARALRHETASSNMVVVEGL
ncbi:MAG: DUF1330 domain-containing protein [Gammaproteobacteria bacterium]|nr:DUF1330 domain-containing protein [Gammaproteobacteria bacterium]NIR83497.1 DUF1330 domain-containing protein [Gammaproteobacteria bacterium]NIR91419.1 DUF1330 domain-containing protein [Gammaproteobacteria bacterium]NIU04659.1 DUF1330 domain-containing protein [Gammaproteobacteria bacterium]NIV51701.1 DUF1330 domain-containing protein [Gammaproteobacteria bacterium]